MRKIRKIRKIPGCMISLPYCYVQHSQQLNRATRAVVDCRYALFSDQVLLRSNINRLSPFDSTAQLIPHSPLQAYLRIYLNHQIFLSPPKNSQSAAPLPPLPPLNPHPRPLSRPPRTRLEPTLPSQQMLQQMQPNDHEIRPRPGGNQLRCRQQCWAASPRLLVLGGV